MKVNKILKIVVIILIIVLLSLVSFSGIYVRNKNKYSNVVKDYKLGMDLSGYRKIRLAVSEEQTNNEETPDETSEETSEETINENKDNYKTAKRILENRLKTMGMDYYEVRLNEENGDIVIYIPENNNTDSIAGQMNYQGKFEIVDKDTQEVLMTNDDLGLVKAGYARTSTSTSTIIALDLNFNKQGTEKFKNITNTYTEVTTTDEETGEEKTTNKEISIKLDGSTLLSTHFDKEISNGVLQLSVGSGTTVEELEDAYQNAKNMEALLNSGKMPVSYKISENQYMASEITNKNIALFVCLCIVLAIAVMIYLIIKYKENGILSSIAAIGYVAILLLAIRVFNVVLTVEGMVAVVVSTTLFFIVLFRLLDKISKMEDKKEAYKRAITQMALVLIPACVISIVFTFNSWQPIFSFGMVMFWGIVINLLYNLIITKALLINSKN